MCNAKTINLANLLYMQHIRIFLHLKFWKLIFFSFISSIDSRVRIAEIQIFLHEVPLTKKYFHNLFLQT